MKLLLSTHMIHSKQNISKKLIIHNKSENHRVLAPKSILVHVIIGQFFGAIGQVEFVQKIRIDKLLLIHRIERIVFV